MDKLYVMVDSGLSSGLKMAQACHALRLFGDEHSEIELEWYKGSSNIVVLEHDEVGEVARELESLGYLVSRFHEPDLDNLLTAICVEPKAWRCLSNIRLAG